MITINKTSCLDAPIKVDALNGVAFTREQGAHKFVIACYQNGEKLNLSGTITGKFTCHGRTVEVALDYAGIDNNGNAWVILSQHCYDYPGRFQLTIFNTVEDTTFCIYACVGNVQSSQIGDSVDGGEIIDTVEDLIEDIADAVATIPADYSDLMSAVAPKFSTAVTYKTGQFVWYEGKLYQFVADHSAGGWIGTDAALVSIGDDVSTLTRGIIKEYSDKTIWRNGAINYSNGTNTSNTSTTRYRTINDVYLENITKIEAKTGYEFAAFAYSKTTGSYAGVWNGNTFSSTGSSSAIWVTSFDASRYPEYKYRVCMREASSAELNADSPENIVFSAYKIDDIIDGITDSIDQLGNEFDQLDEKVDQVDSELDTLQASDVNIRAAMAPTFSDGTAYKAGEYVWNAGQLYIFTIDHAAGAWTGSDAIPAIIGDDVETLTKGIVKNYSDKTIWRNGAINYSNGTNTSNTSTTRYRTKDGVYLENLISIKANDGYQFMACAFSKTNGTYIGSWNGSRFVKSGGSTTVWQTYFNAKDYLDYKYRVAMRSSSDAELTSDSPENIVFSQYRISETSGDITEKLSQLDSEIAQLNGDVSEIKEITPDTVDTLTLEAGAIGENGADLNTTTHTNKSCRTAGFISVSGYEYVELHYTTTTTEDPLLFINFYASDNAESFIKRVGGNEWPAVECMIPSNAAFMRISFTLSTVAQVTDYSLKLYNPLAFVNRNVPVKMYVMGDSISAGYYSLLTADLPEGVTPAITYEDGTCCVWDRSLSHTYWHLANKWFLHNDLQGLAYPGQGYFRKSSNNENGVDVVTNNSFADAGLIIVAWGFNDWHYNLTRGDHTLISEFEPIATQSTDPSTITTINQAIWYCFGVLIDKAPNAKIVVQTPMNGWRYGGTFDTQWGINYAKSNSGTIKDIHDDIIYWCNYYGLKYIDMTFNNSIVNNVNIKTTIIDGSHPSALAHEQLARDVWKKI